MIKSRDTITTGDGSILHYEIHGTPSASHPSLVFLHYYGGSPTTFAPLLSQLHLQSFHKVLYHARGWSPSTGPADPTAYGISTMSADLSTILSHTGVADHSAGFILIGHSMGAKVAQHYAATAASPALRGLLLVAPAPLHGLSLPPEAKAQQRAAYQSAEGVRFVLDNVLTAGPGTLGKDVVEQCVRDSMRGNEVATAAWPEYAAGEEYAELQEGVRVPVVVLRGDKDFEREVVGELGVEQGWVNRTVEDCGHLIPLEKPERLGKEVLDFVERIS
ncbi:alpha/beta-hydrolase [Viridothelium virens]|uniref:Alpha/beta-hydrolase n=1 Tax=Viridothelium virens TaxID=1048519 RepID=A0A6A6HH56_VIRVR|nr:alpha/beta-hydrolase [Viridothelium virens]